LKALGKSTAEIRDRCAGLHLVDAGRLRCGPYRAGDRITPSILAGSVMVGIVPDSLKWPPNFGQA